MIPVKLKSNEIFAYDFDKNDGELIYAEIETIRRWKRTLDAWEGMQNEMQMAVLAAKPPPDLPLPPITQWAGIRAVDAAPETPEELQTQLSEAIAFDSRSYKGSGINNGVIHEQPKQLPVPEPPREPAAQLREAPKRKRGRPRQKAKDPAPEQKADPAQMGLA